MAYSVTQLKSDMAGALHGTTVNQITNLYGLLFRAASELLADIDPEETRRTVGLSTPIYGQVYDYACPTDLKGNRIIDIRPYVNRSQSDRTLNAFSADFDRLKSSINSGSLVETRWNTGVKTIRLSIPSEDNVLIDSMDAIGNWTAVAGASGLEVDNVNFAQGGGSLKYDLSGSGYIVNSLLTSDISAFGNDGVVFLYVWSPSTVPNGHTIRIGTDASNYWTSSVTAQWDGTAYVTGWNLLGFDLGTATKVGSPSYSNIDYAYIYTNQTGTSSPVRADWLMAAPGKMMEMEYYSKYLFRSVTGTFQERPLADTDRINLDTDSYMAYFNKVMQLSVQQQQGQAGAADAKTFKEAYDNQIKQYLGKYPSQSQKTQTTYYQVKRRDTSGMIGRRVGRP